MATVYIVRHGNTFDKGDTVLRVGGATDLPLSTSGQAQAAALGEMFKDIAFDRAVVSPLKRTRMTADAILSRQACAPKPEFNDSLIEVDYGPDEGKPEDEVIARIGQDALDAWEADATVPQDWKVDPAALRQAWRDLLNDTKGTELIVTSNGIARFVLDEVVHDGAERKLKTGAYGVLEGSGDVWRVIRWNVRP
jgi:broad specificity phosphatase PhoE